MKSKLIYIASPYTHSDNDIVQKRYTLVAKYISSLIAEGYVVISPIFYGHNILKYEKLPGDYSFWKNFCESFIYKCDEVWVYKLPAWEESNGIREELKLAKKLNIPIKYIEPS